MHLPSLFTQNPDLAAKARGLLSEPDTPFPILSAKIKLTWRCNLRCRVCTVWRKPAARSAAGDALGLETVRHLLVTLQRQGLRKIHFSGGEVFVRPDFADILAFAHRLGLQINLTTNGTLIDKEAARRLVRTRVHSVTVSIDSPDEAQHDEMRGRKGAWRATWRGVRRLQRRRAEKGRGPHIAVNTVVTRANVAGMGRLHHLLAGSGIDSWLMLPVDTEQKKLRPTEAQWRALAEQWEAWRPLLRRPPIDWSSERSAARAGKGKYAGVYYGERGCFAPWFNLFVDADGSVYPCCMGKGDMRPYGNLLQEPVERLLDGTGRRELRCSMAGGHVFPVCERCDDFLEENGAFASLYEKEETVCSKD
ncbi:MAG: radical SAM protein [Kiritimatiellae bacterium]|nr:radical SAM protein [Kiritimatiellia bacterium]